MEWVRKNSKLIIFCLIIAAILVLNHIFGWSSYLSNSDNLRFLSEMINDHFILTNPEFGLTDDDVEEAIDILCPNGDSDVCFI